MDILEAVACDFLDAISSSDNIVGGVRGAGRTTTNSAPERAQPIELFAKTKTDRRLLLLLF